VSPFFTQADTYRFDIVPAGRWSWFIYITHGHSRQLHYVAGTRKGAERKARRFIARSIAKEARRRRLTVYGEVTG
jgi:hypothetical protein